MVRAVGETLWVDPLYLALSVVTGETWTLTVFVGVFSGGVGWKRMVPLDTLLPSVAIGDAPSQGRVVPCRTARV